jgi:hypothetical protein
VRFKVKFTFLFWSYTSQIYFNVTVTVGLVYKNLNHFHSHPEGPGAHPVSCTMLTGSFLGVKWLGHGVNHPSPSCGEVKERVEWHLHSPFVPSWHVIGWTFTCHHCIWVYFKDICVVLAYLLKSACIYEKNKSVNYTDSVCLRRCEGSASGAGLCRSKFHSDIRFCSVLYKRNFYI